MPLNLFRSRDTNFLIMVILGIVIFYMFVYPCLEKKDKEVKENFENTLNNLYKIDMGMCSPDCCGSQWPVSFDTVRDSNIGEGEVTKEGVKGTKYTTSNFTCSGLNGRGCLCLTNDQHEILASRGGNAI